MMGFVAKRSNLSNSIILEYYRGFF